MSLFDNINAWMYGHQVNRETAIMELKAFYEKEISRQKRMYGRILDTEYIKRLEVLKRMTKEMTPAENLTKL